MRVVRESCETVQVRQILFCMQTPRNVRAPYDQEVVDLLYERNDLQPRLDTYKNQSKAPAKFSHVPVRSRWYVEVVSYLCTCVWSLISLLALGSFQ